MPFQIVHVANTHRLVCGYALMQSGKADDALIAAVRDAEDTELVRLPPPHHHHHHHPTTTHTHTHTHTPRHVAEVLRCSAAHARKQRHVVDAAQETVLLSASNQLAELSLSRHSQSLGQLPPFSPPHEQPSEPSEPSEPSGPNRLAKSPPQKRPFTDIGEPIRQSLRRS